MAGDLGAALHEEQQATLLSILRSAGGAPVSYAHLRDHGIEFPANVAAELELQGIGLERCQLADAPHDADGSRRLGLRLPAEQTPAHNAVLSVDPPAGGKRTPWTAEGRVKGGRGAPRVARTHVRWLALLALCGAIAAAAAIIAVEGLATHGSNLPARQQGEAHRSGTVAGAQREGRTRHTTGRHLSTSASSPARTSGASDAESKTGRKAQLQNGNAHTSPSTGHAAHAGRSATPPTGTRTQARRRPSLAHLPPTPVSATLATKLEAEGHALIDAGRPSQAVSVLTRAVAATGEHPGDCLQPSGETCLTYAYALFDLGHALQMSGRAGAAVPILRERLQIDNQRPVVQAELELALAQSHHHG